MCLELSIKKFGKQLDAIQQLTTLQVKEFLNVQDMCVLLGCSKRFVYNLTSEKVIPYYKPFGSKMLYFKKSEVEAYMQNHIIASNEQVEREATLLSLNN